MEEAKTADTKPKLVELKEGETYMWCACGRSADQPFCDGTHKGTGLKPKVFTAEKSGSAALCMCRQTKNPPFCDGTHKTLK